MQRQVDRGGIVVDHNRRRAEKTLKQPRRRSLLQQISARARAHCVKDAPVVIVYGQHEDGQVGTVSWASYAPGESYMVVSYRDGHSDAHHVVPAGAVKLVDHGRRAVVLEVTAAEVKATPRHETPDAAVDWDQVNHFERGMLGGASVWPYTDV